jgi:hypothetical protein
VDRTFLIHLKSNRHFFDNLLVFFLLKQNWQFCDAYHTVGIIYMPMAPNFVNLCEINHIACWHKNCCLYRDPAHAVVRDARNRPLGLPRDV